MKVFFNKYTVDATTLDWNTFFQFVIIFVFSPTTVLFYFLIHSFNNNPLKISLEDILGLLELILNRYCSEETIEMLFSSSDLYIFGIIIFLLEIVTII